MTSADATCRLDDLLRVPPLMLELVVGDQSALNRPVSGAHVIEIPGPTRWLTEQHAVLLTTGMRLRGRPDEQRQLVRDLQDVGATALGFGVGPVFSAIPQALLDEAQQRNFPVMRVPAAVPLPDVTAMVYRATASEGDGSFHQLANMQRYLLEALVDQRPVRSVVERLARWCHATAAVIRRDGGIDVSTGALPASAVREEIGDTTAPLFELQVSGWHGIAAEVRLANGSQPRWLVVVSRRDNFPDRAAKAAAYVAAPLISALSRLDVLGRQQDRAIRSAVLDDALDLQPGDDTHLVESRAAALGVDFSRDSQVLVASRVQGAAPAGGKDRAGAKDTAVMWADRLQRGLEELAIPHLMLSREDGSVWLVQADSSRIRSVLEGLLAKQPTMVVGLGRRIGHIAEAPASFHDASLAAQHLARSADQGRLLSYDEFDLGTLLLADVGTDRMSPWARDVLRPLESKPILLEALEAYFKNNFDIMATAKSMHVHHNTLRYRISRIEEALGQSLRNPATIASLHLALVASSATRRGEGRRRSRPLTPSRRDPSDVRGALPSHEDPTAHEAFIDLPPSFGVTGNLR